MKRNADGDHRQIPSQIAIEEIAARLKSIIDQHGPRSVGIYQGTGQMAHPIGNYMGTALLKAIGSPNFFSAATIDKPADLIAPALHGNWMAGGQSFSSADTWLIVGGNPVIAKSAGCPNNNPGMRLKEAVNRGMKLIVVDPRRTETAKRAHIHLQAKPGEDAAILAAFINIILREDLYDRAFVAANARGIKALKAAVADFTPEIVAARAGIEVADLLSAARTFGSAGRGGVQCATGPSFSMHSNLTFYLAMCLITLCGRWAREGEIALHPNVLLPTFVPKAQPYSPFPVFGDIKLRVHGMRQNASGLPTSALADEILLEGEGQIKALICLGSNPVSAWPDQRKTEAALRSLDLLVSLDITMSATARLADYVVAPPLPL
jgi:anaerobic selenocysteine-containing dehydrogenase